METFVAECGLARQPAPFQFALVEDVADEFLMEAGDMGVQRNVVDTASKGGGGLGLLAERDKLRLAGMTPEAAAAFQEQLAERKRREASDRDWTPWMSMGLARPDPDVARAAAMASEREALSFRTCCPVRVASVG